MESVEEVVEGKGKRVVNAVPTELVKLVKRNVEKEMSVKDVKEVCEAFVKTLIGEVLRGRSVSLTNNMTFKRALRGDRVHKNPKTGEEVHKKAHYVMSMDVKPALKRQFEEIEVDAGEREESGEEKV